MPIAALAPTTVRAIGSASIISDPYSLAKELVDNALDASSSSVTVEVSQDTVDTIQVKDNGHGIPADDYPFVCKHTFTSKIHTVDDLRNVGGTSLGFRGEALASAAEISGMLMVTTRVESEPVGSVLKYGRNGELVSAEKTSHPVGTTIRISNMFRQIPVRRQTAVKNAKKTIARIRKMVQAYAMARPSIRFTFKVMKAKNESGNWVYAPGKKNTLMDAALKVVGTDVASSCELKQWPSSTSDDESPVDSSGFRLIALIPRLGSDFTKFNNQGQFLSIDGRPISAGRGIAQAIVKLYKTHLRSVSSRDGLSPPITDPFLCMHLLCPEEVYDVNIEPSKDDVLFEDQQAVLTLVEDLLRTVYGDQSEASSNGPIVEDQRLSPPNGFNVLQSSQQYHSMPAPTIPSQDKGFVSVRSFARPYQTSHSPPGTNPGKRPGCSPFPNAHARLPGFHRSPRDARPANNPDPGLPSPVSSLDSPPVYGTALSPLSSRTAQGDSSMTQLPATPIRGTREQLRERDKERYGNGSLDTWFLRLSQAQTPGSIDEPRTQTEEPLLSQLTEDRFGSPQTSTNVAPRNASPESVMLLDDSQTPPCTANQPSRTSNRPQGLPVLEQWSARLYNASNPDENPELQKALEFEARKKAAIQERRMQIQSSNASISTNSPHQSRYLAARAALSSQPNQSASRPLFETAAKSSEAAKPILSPHDPRAYLMRLQNSDGANSPKLKRITSSKLPFESTPDGHDLYSLSLTLPADLLLLRDHSKQISQTDLYTKSGDQSDPFTTADINAATQSWHSRLSALIKSHYRSMETSNVPDIQCDFSGLAQRSAGT